MKVLLPIDRVDDAGIGTVTRGLCRFLPTALGSGEQLVLVGGRPPCSTAAGVTHLLTRRPPVSRGRRFLHEQAVLARAARGVDLVHMSDHRPLLASRRPLLVTIHDLFFLERPDWYPRLVVAYKRLMLRASLTKRPVAVVCVSEFTRAQLLGHFGHLDETRVHVVHPGLAAEDAPRDRDPDSDFFLTVSTIEPRKNHLTLLRAYQRARRRGLKLRWVVAGAPGYRSGPIVAALAQAEGVELAGLVADGERERLYRKARFVAFPSYAEGFGFPPLEAMARGVPSICAPGSALDETAGDAALRVPAADADAWADALIRMEHDDGLRAALRRRGLARVSSFDPMRSARRYAEIYRAALGS